MKTKNTEIEIINKNAKDKNIIDPFSALFTLIIDLIFFGGEALTMGLDLPVSVSLAFIITLIITFIIQRKKVGDTLIVAFTKSLILSILAAIPTPIAGTVAGTLLLSIAGIKKIIK